MTSSEIMAEKEVNKWSAGGADKKIPDWIRRLYAGAGLSVNEKRLSWNTVHLDHFLGWCRRLGDGADRLELGELARLYLEDLRGAQANEYRVDQAREVLAVFYRGVSGWKLERKETTDGGAIWQPDFRLKTGPHLESGISHEETAGMERRRAVEAGGWRKQMVEELRVRHYAIRTERSYMDWAERFVRFAGEDSAGWTTEQVERFFDQAGSGECCFGVNSESGALGGSIFVWSSREGVGQSDRCGAGQALAAVAGGAFHRRSNPAFGGDGRNAPMHGHAALRKRIARAGMLSAEDQGCGLRTRAGSCGGGQGGQRPHRDASRAGG